MKLFRIRLNGLYCATKTSVVPFWSEEGTFFTAKELESLIRDFKYQQGLWPKGAEIVEYELGEESSSSHAKTLFDKIEEELTFEKLKGSAY